MKLQELEPNNTHSRLKATLQTNDKNAATLNESIIELFEPKSNDLLIKHPVVINTPGDISPTKKKTRRWRNIRLLNRIANMLSLGIISYKEI